MDTILNQIADWLKGMLVDGIMNNLSGMFDAVNQQVSDVATQVGMTPAGFSPGIFGLVRNISESVIIGIYAVLVQSISFSQVFILSSSPGTTRTGGIEVSLLIRNYQEDRSCGAKEDR